MIPAENMRTVADDARMAKSTAIRVETDKMAERIAQMIAPEVESRIIRAAEDGKRIVWFQHGLGCNRASHGCRGLACEIAEETDDAVSRRINAHPVFESAVESLLTDLAGNGYRIVCRDYSPHNARCLQLPLTAGNAIRNSVEVTW